MSARDKPELTLTDYFIQEWIKFASKEFRNDFIQDLKEADWSVAGGVSSDPSLLRNEYYASFFDP